MRRENHTSTMTAMDDATANLILQILQEDGRDAAAALDPKGKQAAGTETDAQLAMRLFLEEEVQPAETFFADRRMTQSIGMAVYLDGKACELVEREERMAVHDRELSAALSRGGIGPMARSQAEQNPAEKEDDDYEQFINKLSCLYVTGVDTGVFHNDSDEDGDESASLGDGPESSAWAAARQTAKVRQRVPRPQKIDKEHVRQCNSCMEPKHFAELAAAPCKHEYCRECLQRLFRNAMTDEAYFPPRCCKLAIRPGYQTRLLLTTELVRDFERKTVEFSTPNRTYCHAPACASFVPPSRCQNAVATCELCERQTCTSCKPRMAATVPTTPPYRAFLIWRGSRAGSCQQCWNMVDLIIGCNHMNCRCGFQFCYVCGAEWKTCRCERWDEHRLYERAVEIDARNAHPDRTEVARLPGAQLEPPRRIVALMADLRENHECEHARWRGRPGPRQCEECYHEMPQFIYECRQCHFMACRRCRYHRL